VITSIRPSGRSGRPQLGPPPPATRGRESSAWAEYTYRVAGPPHTPLERGWPSWSRSGEREAGRDVLQRPLAARQPSFGQLADELDRGRQQLAAPRGLDRGARGFGLALEALPGSRLRSAPAGSSRAGSRALARLGRQLRRLGCVCRRRAVGGAGRSTCGAGSARGRLARGGAARARALRARSR